MSGAGFDSAVEWLASVAPDPESCLREWESNPLGVTLLPAGRLWDVVILPGDLGTRTLDVLRRFVDCPGPVLGDFGDSRVGFLVPPGTAESFGPGIRSAGRGTWVVVPYPGRATGGVRWLVQPDGSGTLTDPVMLELAIYAVTGEPLTGSGRFDSDHDPAEHDQTGHDPAEHELAGQDPAGRERAGHEPADRDPLGGDERPAGYGGPASAAAAQEAGAPDAGAPGRCAREASGQEASGQGAGGQGAGGQEAGARDAPGGDAARRPGAGGPAGSDPQDRGRGGGQDGGPGGGRCPGSGDHQG